MDEGYPLDDNLPIKVKDLVAVYEHIARSDKSINNEFEGRDRQDTATVVDLTVLFDKLSEHYYGPENDLEAFTRGDDLSEKDDKILV